MDFTVCALLVLASCVAGEELRNELKRKSDAYIAYASEYAEDYEPVAYAALPLHAPLPVLQLLAPQRAPHPAASHAAPHYSRPDRYQRPSPRPYKEAAEPSHNSYGIEELQRPFILEAGRPYSDVARYPEVPRPYPELPRQYAEGTRPLAAGTEVLYARPDRFGGYTYYRKPSKNPVKKNKKQPRPVILRIHKYRVVRD